MKHLKTLLKTVFVFGLLYFLTQKGFISVQDTKRAFDNWQLLLPALLMLCTLVVLGAVRWRWLLEAQGIEMNFMRVFELTLVGNFFNIALPGAVSGDFVKAFYIGKDLPGKRASAFGSILFDRIAGLSGLVLVGGAAMILEGFTQHVDLESARMLMVLKPFMILCALGTIVFYSYLFLVKESWDPVLLTLRKLEAKMPKAGSITRIYEGTRHYHHHRWTVIKVLAISVVIHMTVGWAFLQFAHALGSDQLPLLGVYTIFPFGLLVTAVPVAPAGVGTGHAAFHYLFNLIGSARGADIFTLFALSQIFYGAIGGVVYLRFRAQAAPLPNPEASTSS